MKEKSFPRQLLQAQGGGVCVQEGTAAAGPLYPTLDSKPLAAMQYRKASNDSMPSSYGNGSSLMDADNQLRQSQPSPSLELQLGPQEMQVSLVNCHWM